MLFLQCCGDLLLDIFFLHDPDYILTHFFFILFGLLVGSELLYLFYQLFYFGLEVFTDCFLFDGEITYTVSIEA